MEIIRALSIVDLALLPIPFVILSTVLVKALIYGARNRAIRTTKEKK